MQRKRIINGKYEVIECIGTGGTSEVYLGKQLSKNLSRNVAIKIIDKSKVNELYHYREVDILKQLKHNALPSIIDTYDDEKFVYIIRDYIEGETLESYIDKNGPFDKKEMINFMFQIFDIFGYLHNRENPLIYRDLKPKNIIYKNGFISLIDFGITRNYDKNKEKDTMIMGTKLYVAPELYQKRQSDPRTDIYSIGLTLYFVMTGEHLKTMPEEEKWRQFINLENLKNVINKCEQYKMEDRYQSIEELKQDFILKFNDELLEFKNNFMKITIDNSINRNIYHFKNLHLKIGVMGYKNGVGCTFFCILIAKIFLSLGHKVSIINKSNNDGISSYEKFLDDDFLNSNYNNKKNYFIYQKIHFYKNFNNNFNFDDYDVNIIDYGNQHFWIEDFKSTNLKFFILPAQGYSFNSNLSIIDEIKDFDINFFINLCNEKMARKLSEWLNISNYNNINYITNMQDAKNIYTFIYNLLDVDSKVDLDNLENENVLIKFIDKSKKNIINWIINLFEKI